MSRPSWVDYYSDMSELVSRRGTCARRKVGVVITDREHRLLSTGYNGPPRGHPHCIDEPCPGAFFASGEGLDECEAVHGEINALLQCPDVDRAHYMFSTLTSCMTCAKAIMCTGIKAVYAREQYAHPHAINALLRHGVEIHVLSPLTRSAPYAWARLELGP